MGFIGASLKVSFVKKYADNNEIVHYSGMLLKDQTAISGIYGSKPRTKEGMFCLQSPDYVEESESSEEASTTSQVQRTMELHDSIVERGEPWTDPDFPPQVSSIWDENDAEKDRAAAAEFTW